MAFLGDTTGKVIQDYGKLLRCVVSLFSLLSTHLSLERSAYPVVFIECTFFQPDHKEAAASSLHLHWRLVACTRVARWVTLILLFVILVMPQ